MVIAAIVIFSVALVGIIALFVAKYWEVKAERPLGVQVRTTVDERALRIKAALGNARGELGKLPPTAFYWIRLAVREGALRTARFARYLERQLYRLADVASYKHRFERKEPRSEFLKKVEDVRGGAPHTDGESEVPRI